MASALDVLPPETVALILANDPRIRADLRIIPAAESAGWVVGFRDGHWHNPAHFLRDGVSVWQVVGTGEMPPRMGWRRAVGGVQPRGTAPLLSLYDALNVPESES